MLSLQIVSICRVKNSFQLNTTDKKDPIRQVLMLVKVIHRVAIRLVMKYTEWNNSYKINIENI